MPYKRVAFGMGFQSFRYGEDGEVEGVHRDASKFIGLLCKGIVAALGIAGTVPDV